MKFIVYYRVKGGTRVNRDYPDYPAGTDVKKQWSIEPGNFGVRLYLQHEPHDDYTAAFAPMVGKPEPDQRQWLENRVQILINQAAQQAAARQAGITPIPAPSGNVHPGHKPGDIVRDQFGRSGKVPEVPMEVFRSKPINTDAAMDAVRSASKGS